MSFFSKLFGKPEGKPKATEDMPEPTSTKQCETCSRRMEVLGISGGAGVVLSLEEMMTGRIGAAEQCWECERVYCNACYPNRPRNTCVCGLGRLAVREVGGTTHRGSLHLVKVRYSA